MDRFFISTHVPNFMKIPPLEAELFRLDRHELNGHFSIFCESAYNVQLILRLCGLSVLF